VTTRNAYRRTTALRYSDSGSTTGHEADISPLRRSADIDPLNQRTHEGCWRDGVTIRIARPTDRPALLRLAELDCARIPNDQLMVAEANGRIVAAVPSRAARSSPTRFVPPLGSSNS
jgi:hypothetical protein